MSGATFDTGEEGEPTSATCPECGQSVAKLADLRRSRRPKSLIAAGLALLVLGAGGLLAASLVGRPMGLVPRFALTTWLFLPGDAPEWVTEEIWQRSLNQSDGQIGFTLTRRWIDGVIADKTVGHDPQLLEVITALVDYNSGWPSQDSVPLSDLEQAWAIANPELAERLVLGDAGTHAEAAQMLARMDWLLTVLLQEHPDLPQRNARDMRRPADVFPPPEYAVQIDSELESAFTSAPHLISSLNPLLGPHAYDRYREPLLAAFDTLPEDSRDFTVLCYLFGQAIYISDEARADALGLIESDTEQDVIHGLRAVTGSIYLGRPTLGPELLNAIRARATDPSDRIRQQAWHTLQRVDRIDPKTMRQVAEIAMASASDAERVLNGFYTDYFRSRSDVTMAYLRQLAASPDPAVRLVVAQNVKHIPLNVDASREILTLLSGDDDPEVARAAELRLDP